MTQATTENETNETKPSKKKKELPTWRTDRDVLALPVPDGQPAAYHHATVPRLYCRVTRTGCRSFAVKYGNAGQWYPIGQLAAGWPVAKVMQEAKRLNRQIDAGHDPAAERRNERKAKTIGDLAALYLREHADHLRPGTRRGYVNLIKHDIVPLWGSMAVTALDGRMIKAKHKELKAKFKVKANRFCAIVSILMTLAVNEGLRPDNPARAARAHSETRRKRYLTNDETDRLVAELHKHPEKISAHLLLFLLVTGCRVSEARLMRWSDVNLQCETWRKPAETTKSKEEHEIPLNRGALDVLNTMQAERLRLQRDGFVSPFVFPSLRKPGQPMTHVLRTWQSVRDAAKLENMRIHDLRHSYASMLVNADVPLPAIGALLGHKQLRTTERYSHLYQDTLRAATEKAAKVVKFPVPERKTA